MFNFTSLLGAQSASPASQSLLEFDGGVKVLIDVGWDESFDTAKLKELEKHIPTLSFILLTHATTAHLGAFVHCCKHFPLFKRIPIYATTPVISLGRTLLQDLYDSTPLACSIIPTDALAESSYSFPSLNHETNPNILMQAPTPEEIASYFGLINGLKYSQPHQPLPSPFSPPLGGLTVTAYSAGHTLGGTIWHIQHNTESVVYAVDWNQAKEHVLSGAAWLGGPGTGGSEVLEHLRRPTAMICSSRGSAGVARQRNKRDEALLSMIRDTVANGGSVLIPSDSSARVLELAYFLEETWENETTKPDSTSPLKNSRLYLASRTGGATMRHVRSMLEWMEEGIMKEYEIKLAAYEAEEQRLFQKKLKTENAAKKKGGMKTEEAKKRDEAKRREDLAIADEKSENEKPKVPFDFRHLTFLERKSRVTRMLSSTEPRVVLASDTSLEWGFSKDAVRSFASDERNLIILTERAGDFAGQQMGLGRYLWDLWNERSPSSEQEPLAAIINTSGEQVTLRSSRAAALDGNELPLYQQYLATQRQLQNTMQGDSSTALETSADVVDDRSSSSSDTSEDSDVEHQGKALNTATTLQHARNKLGLSDAELGINILIRRKNVYDYEVRGKKGREKMFPHVAKRRRADDFGDLIRPEEFVVANEDDQIDGEARGDNSKKENTVGQKRKWDSVAVQPDSGRRMLNGMSKRRSHDASGNGANDGVESSDDEPEDDPDKVEGPSKVLVGTEMLQLKCRITFVDFSGLHDRRTIQMMMPLIKPRKLILIAGDEAETNDLAEDCRKILNAGSGDAASIVHVFTPTLGMVINASVDTNSWSVKLSRGMVRKLQWQKVRGLGVVAITGKLAAASLQPSLKEEEGTAKKKAKMDAAVALIDSEMDTTPVLDVVPMHMTTVRSVAQPFHVGDLRLADLRKLMQSSGMRAEFRGEGVLVINGTVAVRKTATGKIEIDGGAYSFADPKQGATFFQVKKQIYEGLAVVAGG
jgi:cleavage and polyadenylation specificity factor subunit 2